MLGDQWRRGDTKDFYKNNPTYLFDELDFNGNPNWMSKIYPVLKIQNESHLDIGCGIGTLCLLRAMQGYESTGYDTNEATINFAKFRARKYGLKVNFTTEYPDLSKYDLITAIDTLEHIEDLRNFLLRIGDLVKMDTMFYHIDTFGYQDINPMHFDHSAHISKWLEEAGFQVVTREWAIRESVALPIRQLQRRL